MLDGRSGFDIVFEMGHQMCTVPLNLLVRGNGTEDDFGKLTTVEGSVCNSSWYMSAILATKTQVVDGIPNNFKRFLHDCHGKMGAVIDKTSYVVLWHFGQLLLKDTFEAREDDETLPGIVIVHNPELDLPGPLLNHGRL